MTDPLIVEAQLAARDKEIKRLTAIETAVRDLEPYFDQLICYASTTSEYKPNLLVKNMREALAND